MKVYVRRSALKRVRMCGFRRRMSTRGGRAIISRRRRQGKRAVANIKRKK
ncbi:MAG TPA: 50S ribosomal protein L34 [Candidatus Brocadiia bacterium]|nr:50S ribosomal protein L34 [Candidatus Brocadiia bacterium]